MTRDEFIANNRIEDVLSFRGIKVNGKSARCPLHEDKTASLSIDREKQVWHCHAGCGGGSVIDLMAKLAGQDPVAFIKAQGIGSPNGNHAVVIKHKPKPAEPQPKIDRSYSYTNAIGQEVFQVVRMVPKTFRQRHRNAAGEWVWSMEGVERVLYRLHEVAKSQTIALCEGEKDAETLTALGYCGTCNVGGAEKWLDGYTETLAGKDVLIFGDNDDAGRRHVETVFESIAGKVKTAKLIEIPKNAKDISDYVATFNTQDEARAAVRGLVDAAVPFFKGVKLPMFTMEELEGRYTAFVRESSTYALELGAWLPSFRRLRPLVPGDLVMLVGNTGIGKTALLSSIALAAKPLKTLMFQFELPDILMFERFCAAAVPCRAREVEEQYRSGTDAIGPAALRYHFGHILVCSEPRKTVEQIEQLIVRSELKFGSKPNLVLLDYVQLIPGKGGSRYDRASNVAEELKMMAKATRTIVIIGSQVHRPGDKESPEVGLHDAKETGSLENSCSLVIGAWRDDKPNLPTLRLRVLKATRGGAGLEVECNFDGECMAITERARHRLD